MSDFKDNSLRRIIKTSEIGHTNTTKLPLCPSISITSHYGFSNQVKTLFTSKQDDAAIFVLPLS